MKRIQYALLILVVFPAFLLSSCCRSPFADLPDETPQDEYIIDNLPGSSDPLFKLDREKIDKLVEDINNGDYGDIHNLIIIHNDSLALEEYFVGSTRHMRHPWFSVTKSVSSALIGIAIDQGYIAGVDEKLLDFFPEYTDIKNLDSRKEAVTLEHVLNMTAGFKWDETSTPYVDECWNPNPDNDSIKWQESSDWIKYVLDLPMSDDPGTKYVYNSGASHLLSGIIKNRTGKSAEEFAKENLFSALGITYWMWEKDPNDLTWTAGGLTIHPVNMAMYGYLYLKNGVLNGEQIIPKDWIKESTSPQIEKRDPDSGELIGYYGYHWGVNTNNTLYFGAGLFGQSLFVIPGIDMVVTMTAGNPEDYYSKTAADILSRIAEAVIR